MKIQIPSKEITLNLPKIIVLVVTFMAGLVVGLGGESKLLAILIGAIAAIFAFLGVIYSKQQERLLKEYELKRGKIEEFVVHSFKLVEVLLKAMTLASKIQKNEFEDVRSPEELALYSQLLSDMLAEANLLIGQCSGYIALYENDIGSKMSIHELRLAQAEAINSIVILMTNRGSGNVEERFDTMMNNIHNCTGSINKLRQSSLEIVSNIKI